MLDSIVGTTGDTKTRNKLFDELKKSMTNHAIAEERYLYNPMIKHDKTQQHARHIIAEHHEMDELIEELEEADMASAEWLKKFKHLNHRLLHHLDEEECEIFPVAGKVLTDTKKIIRKRVRS